MHIWSHILTWLTCFFLLFIFFSSAPPLFSCLHQAQLHALQQPCSICYRSQLGQAHSCTWSLEYPIPLSHLLSLSRSLICIRSLFVECSSPFEGRSSSLMLVLSFVTLISFPFGIWIYFIVSNFGPFLPHTCTNIICQTQLSCSMCVNWEPWFDDCSQWTSQTGV